MAWLPTVSSQCILPTTIPPRALTAPCPCANSRNKPALQEPETSTTPGIGAAARITSCWKWARTARWRGWETKITTVNGVTIIDTGGYKAEAKESEGNRVSQLHYPPTPESQNYLPQPLVPRHSFCA